MDRTQIKDHSDLIEAIYGLTAGRAMTQNLVTAAVGKLVDSADGQKLKLKADYMDDWKLTMTRRLRNMLHDVADAAGNKAMWSKREFWQHVSPDGRLKIPFVDLALGFS